MLRPKLLIAGLILWLGSAHGATYKLDVSFGSTDVSSYPIATFEDVSGGVRLTMALPADFDGFVAGGGSAAAAGGWYFNLNPTLNPSSLAFAFQAGQNAVGVDKGTNSYRAGGDGLYDFRFRFASAGTGRLTAGETSVWLISGFTGLTAADFNFFSAARGGAGPFLTAAHVQGIGSSGASTWVGAVPEPAPITFVGIAAAAALFFLRRGGPRTRETE